MRLFLLLFLPVLAYGQFDTGLTYEQKYWVGNFATISGLAMISYTDGPTEAVGCMWVAGGVANLISAEIALEEEGYYPGEVRWGKEVPALACMFAAGMINGVNQDLMFHYNEFQNTFPNANPEFWDPSISWRNKYKNGDPSQGEAFLGSSTIFVAATDGYHATIAGRNLMITTSICLSPRSRSWKSILKRTVLYTLTYSVGFELMYDKIIK